ncbi:hypothetical protein Tco_1434767, partial [Tanacetum coccineum]
MVTLVDGVLANGVVMIFEMDIAFYAIQGMEILSLMIRLRILSIILPIFHTHLHNPNSCHTLETISEIEHAFEDKQYQLKDRPAFYYDDDDDDDDDEESSISLRDIIISGLPLCIAITPDLSTVEPVDSLIMKDEHLDTIPAMESDEVIMSSVEDLVHTPSESDGISE